MKFFCFYLTLPLIFLISSCGEDCEISPDLVSDLLSPSSQILVGEPVDWDYVVESVEENSEDCSILNALASISRIAINFFTNENDPDSDLLFERNEQIDELKGGQSMTVDNRINVFQDEGIYMLEVNADDTNIVEERNENNNADNGNVEIRRASNFLFANMSLEFEKKLERASAIVLVGEKYKNIGIQSYFGKPIYYAK